MKSKTLAGGLILALCLVPALLFAQTSNDEEELTRQIIESSRKLIVSRNMQLTEQEKEAFWPLYEQFQEKLSAINERTIRLIEEYALEYYTLSDDKAKSMLREALSIEEDRLKLRKKFLKKFESKLPAKTVARYYQIERKLYAIVQYELAIQIPLIKPD